MTTPEELFPVAETQQDSPRLRWLKKHMVRTHLSRDIEDGQGRWVAAFAQSEEQDAFQACQYWLESAGDESMGYGDTEEEAIADLAQKHGVPLWNEEYP